MLIDFEGFVQTEGQPIYLQIMRYIKQGMASGIIADGEELPSRRALSAYLTVNPNTVQKAYRLLEEEGLVQSHAGAKSFVCATERQRAALRRELTENELRGMVRNMKGMRKRIGHLIRYGKKGTVHSPNYWRRFCIRTI